VTFFSNTVDNDFNALVSNLGSCATSLFTSKSIEKTLKATQMLATLCEPPHLKQECKAYDPRATFGPRELLIRPPKHLSLDCFFDENTL
jgi:hypothetical protein